MTSPGMACFSAAQAPRSMSLQRSLQKGRQREASAHSTGRWQVGQRTTVMTNSSLASPISPVSGADGQLELHVLCGLNWPRVHIVPRQEADAAAVVAAADLGKQLRAGRER